MERQRELANNERGPTPASGDGEQSHTRPARLPSLPEQPAEHALLGLLTLSGGSAHGYDLARQFQRGRPLGDVIRLEPAMLYKHLKKLARLGWVTMSLEDQAPRPPRQVCHLTPLGEAELRRWLAEPVVHTREIRLAFLVKLYFAWRIEPPLALRLADEQGAIMRRIASSLAQQVAAVDTPDVAPSPMNEIDDTFRRLVLGLRLEQTRAAASWLEEVAQSFGAQQQDR